MGLFWNIPGGSITFHHIPESSFGFWYILLPSMTLYRVCLDFPGWWGVCVGRLNGVDWVWEFQCQILQISTKLSLCVTAVNIDPIKICSQFNSDPQCEIPIEWWLDFVPTRISHKKSQFSYNLFILVKYSNFLGILV